MPRNNDFKVPLDTYAATVAGSQDEIWLRFMRANNGGERHTEAYWHEILVSYRDGTPLAPEKFDPPPSDQVEEE